MHAPAAPTVAERYERLRVHPPLTFRRSTGRIPSLDILRGWAVALMLLALLLPRTLPNWMGPGAQPHFRPSASVGWASALVAGQPVLDASWKALTWVDLVFPMFLFAMGAAIPLALSRERERGATGGQIAWRVVRRWMMLIAFAVIVSNIVPPTTPTTNADTQRLLTIASFGVVFLFFVRWPAGTPSVFVHSVRWVAGLVLTARIAGYAVRRGDLGLSDPSQYFNWSRADTIILVLAQTYLVAALAWGLMRRWPGLRLVSLLPLILLAHVCQPQIASATSGFEPSAAGDWPWRMGLFTLHGQSWTLADVVQLPKHALDLPGWIGPLKDAAQSRPWVAPAFDLSPLWDFSWYRYLLMVVAGTIVGDWLLRWGRRSSIVIEEAPPAGARTLRPLATRWLPLTLALLITTGTLAGLRNYGMATLGLGGPLRTPAAALLLALPLLVALGFAVLPMAHGEHWVERRLFKIGAFSLTVGLILACVPTVRTPAGWRIFEGGLTAGPPSSLSYSIVSIGLCCVLLIGLMRAFDRHMPGGQPRLGPIAATGQNALLAYFTGHVLLGALFGLSLFTFLGSPFGSAVRSLDDLLNVPTGINPWLHAAIDLAQTASVIGFAWVLTRARIVWRA